MTKTDLEAQDLFINADDITVFEKDNLFHLEPIPARQYHAEEFQMMQISLEMNLDQLSIERQIYSSLELISDIGGIQAILLSLFGSILSVFNYNNFDTFLASRLFKLKKPQNEIFL